MTIVVTQLILKTFTPSPSSWRLKNVERTQLGKMIVKGLEEDA